MDDCHKKEDRKETLKHDADGPSFRPSDGRDHGVERMDEEITDEQNQERQDEGLPADQQEHEADAGENEEEMEEDETEGLRKSLKKGFKAVKRFFKGPAEQGNGDDPESTFQEETQLLPVSAGSFRPEDDMYSFTYPKRGRAIIINNEKFQKHSMFDSRPGSTCDANALKEVFKQLGFDVRCHSDLNAMEMKQALEKEAHLYDHQNADCLAVAILSHGDSEVLEQAWSYHQKKAHLHDDKVRRDLIFGVDGSHISTASVIRTFQDDRCPGLQGKPRLFFIQACRGDSYDDGVGIPVLSDDATEEADDDVGDSEDARGFHLHRRRYVVSPAPIFKDFLVMYATTPGHFAWRRPSGTWFVQSFHTVFTKQLTRHMSLTQALTRVTRMVAHGYQSQSNKANMTGKKQTPVIESMLTKDIYFSKK